MTTWRTWISNNVPQLATVIMVYWVQTDPYGAGRILLSPESIFVTLVPWSTGYQRSQSTNSYLNNDLCPNCKSPVAEPEPDSLTSWQLRCWQQLDIVDVPKSPNNVSLFGTTPYIYLMQLEGKQNYIVQEEIAYGPLLFNSPCNDAELDLDLHPAKPKPGQ